MSDKPQHIIDESLERFRRAHREGMRALKSSDGDRMKVFAQAIDEECRAVEAYTACGVRKWKNALRTTGASTHSDGKGLLP